VQEVQRRCGREAYPALLPAGRHRQHGEQVPNARLCKALIDRITDRVHTIETGAESYRFRRTPRKKQERKLYWECLKHAAAGRKKTEDRCRTYWRALAS
jgi:hypothetical protein